MKFLYGLIIGYLAQRFYLTSPVHEFGHKIVARFYGIPGTVSWRSFQPRYHLPGSAVVPVMWAGINFEFYTFLILAAIIAWRKPHRAGWIAFCSGVSLGVFSIAHRYTDLDRINSYGIVAWYVIASAMLIICGVFLIIQLTNNATGYSMEKTAYSK